MHRRIDEIVERVGRLETSVVSFLQDDVTKMKPVTDDVRREKLLGLVALGVIGFGGIAMVVTLPTPSAGWVPWSMGASRANHYCDGSHSRAKPSWSNLAPTSSPFVRERSMLRRPS